MRQLIRHQAEMQLAYAEIHGQIRQWHRRLLKMDMAHIRKTLNLIHKSSIINNTRPDMILIISDAILFFSDTVATYAVDNSNQTI